MGASFRVMNPTSKSTKETTSPTASKKIGEVIKLRNIELTDRLKQITD